MKLGCRIRGVPALIVGYVSGKKGRIRAIVICQGALREVKLRQLELDADRLPPELLAPAPPTRLGAKPKVHAK